MAIIKHVTSEAIRAWFCWGQCRTCLRAIPTGFYLPGPQSRCCQHADGVPVCNQQYLLPGYYPGARNCGVGLDVGARTTGVFHGLIRIGLEIGVNLWLCAGSKRPGMIP